MGCTSGMVALTAMQERPFDLLLTDLMMPELDGNQPVAGSVGD